MDETTNLLLPYILAAQAQKHITHNEALRKLDAIVQLSAVDRDLAAPPGAPVDGGRYIVASSPSGAWAGQAGRIAAWQDGAWAFHAPREGWIAWLEDESLAVVWSGTDWVPLAGEGVNPTPLVGINATADTTNRLAVSSPAILLNHAGAGHQAKINKAAAADTASLLFQTGFSGRAEMGTAGDDDFHFKVSPDGSAWTEAIVIDKDTGEVGLPGTPTFARPSAFPLFPCTAISTLYGSQLHHGTGGVTANAMVADRLYMARLAVSKAHTITEFALRVGTGSAGNGRIGLYEAGTDGLPGDLLFDSGDMSTTSAAFLTAAASVPVRPGIDYWLCAIFSATPSVSSLNSANHGSMVGHVANTGVSASVFGAMYRAKAYGALDASEAGQTWTLVNVQTPYMFWK